MIRIYRNDTYMQLPSILSQFVSCRMRIVFANTGEFNTLICLSQSLPKISNTSVYSIGMGSPQSSIQHFESKRPQTQCGGQLSTNTKNTSDRHKKNVMEYILSCKCVYSVSCKLFEAWRVTRNLFTLNIPDVDRFQLVYQFRSNSATSRVIP